MSPCLMCAEKNCHNCPCAICEVVNGKLQDNFIMQTAMKNKADCKKFMVRLSVAGSSMMIWFRGCSAIVKRRWQDGIHSIYYGKSLL